MPDLTLKAVCAEKSNWQTEWTALAFSADKEQVAEGLNTNPYISISVNVGPEVAQLFEKGSSYTLTIAPSES